MTTEIQQNDIIRIEKIGNKTFMIFAKGEVSESLLSIDELDNSLSDKGFIRIHTNHLINHHHLKHRFDKLTQWVSLDNGDKLPIGSQHFISKKHGLKHIIQYIFKRNKH